MPVIINDKLLRKKVTVKNYDLLREEIILLKKARIARLTDFYIFKNNAILEIVEFRKNGFGTIYYICFIKKNKKNETSREAIFLEIGYYSLLEKHLSIVVDYELEDFEV